MRLKILALILTSTLLLASCGKDNSSNETYGELPTNVFRSDVFKMSDSYYASSMVYKDGYVYILGEGKPCVLVKYDLDGNVMETRQLKTVIDKANVLGFGILSDGSYITEERYVDMQTNTLLSGIAKYSADDELLIWIDEEEYMPFKIHVTDDDIIYLIDNTTTIMSSDLEVIGEIKVGRIDECHITNDNKLVIQAFDQTTMKNKFRYIDTVTQSLSKEIITPDYNIDGNYNAIFYSDSDKYDYYLSNTTGLYGCVEGETPTAELIVNWTNSNIPSRLYELIILSDDNMICHTYNDFKSKREFAYLTHIPDDEITPKKIINIAYVGSYQLQYMPLILEFNKTNLDYQIILNDYSKYNDSSDNTIGQNLLNADIAAGKIPDLFIFQSDSFKKSYVEQNLFANLYDYIEADSLLNCIRYPLETDDKLYQLIYSFNIQTLAAKSKFVGDESGWTLGEMIDAFEKSDIEYLIRTNSPIWIVNDLLKIAYTELIDIENRVCHFDSDEFKRFIELTDRLRHNKTTPSSGFGNEEYINENVFLAQFYNISKLINYYANNYWFFGNDDMTLIGYPSANTNGSCVNYDLSICASSQTKNIEGVQQFFNFILEDESVTYNKKHGNSLPPTLSGLRIAAMNESNLVYAIYPENGYSATEVNKEEFKASQPPDTLILEFTEDDINAYIDYIQSVNYVMDYTKYQAFEIMLEELEIYFSGAKSLDETINVIQNRITLFINE